MKTSYLPEELRRAWDKHPGAWNREPDRVEWREEMTGLVCLALRHPQSGHWCGYVGVPAGHPWHGKHYDDVAVEVHGGLTFANACQAGSLGEHRVCHTPEPGEPDHLWWLGFDCAHSGDVSPVWSNRFRRMPFETYKTLSFVRGQCESLARQVELAKE